MVCMYLSLSAYFLCQKQKISSNLIVRLAQTVETAITASYLKHSFVLLNFQ